MILAVQVSPGVHPFLEFAGDISAPIASITKANFQSYSCLGLWKSMRMSESGSH